MSAFQQSLPPMPPSASFAQDPDHSQLPQPERVYDLYSWSTLSPNTRLVYVKDEETANQIIPKLQSKVLGFDLEWKPNFVKGRPENPVALVQLASENLVVLVHVCYMHTFPEKLRELLADETVVKAGVGIQKDCKKLYADYGVDTRNCVDLSLLARTVDNARWKGKYASPIGLSRLCETYEELSLQKGRVQTSNWEQLLDSRQQDYAANDCHAGLTLYTRLSAMAATMSPVPQTLWYTFDTISGFLYQPSSGILWHPYNPYYDPGPPPPPRPPRVEDGFANGNMHEQFRGSRYARRNRVRHPPTRPLSPAAPSFVPGAKAHTPSPSSSPVPAFASPPHTHTYTRSPVPRYAQVNDAPAGTPFMEVDADGLPRPGRAPRAFQGKPSAFSHAGLNPNAPGRDRGSGRGRGQTQTVSLGYFAVTG